MIQAATNNTMVDSLGADIANVGGWTEDTILLVLGYSKTERYFPVVRQNLDLFWPGRPRTLFVTDGNAVGEDIVRGKDCTFLELLSVATHAVRERFPSTKNVFLLLEDLCPLGPVDEEKLARAQNLMRENGKKFLCHMWDRKRLNGEAYYDFLDGQSTLRDDKISLFHMASDFTRSNSLVGAFWDLEHLEDVIAAKRRLGIHDPWGFELRLPDQSEDHYMFSGIWPVCKDGFLVQGKFNTKAISRRAFPDSPLMSHLRIEYCGVDSFYAAALKRAWFRLGNSIRKRVGHMSDTSPSPMANDRRR